VQVSQQQVDTLARVDVSQLLGEHALTLDGGKGRPIRTYY
jgi:hypothetical protein